MPELPEVEVVRRGLERWVLRRPFAQVAVVHPRAVRRHLAGPADFTAVLAGRSLTAACRRGKYLWFPLSEPGQPDATAELALVAHLGMSGQLLVQPESAPVERHLRVRFSFADADRGLRFVDQRTFGGLSVEPLGPDQLPVTIAHIARDPLDPDFDPAALLVALRRRRTGLKRALLDQSLVSGVGNIYADEALWRAGLHYAYPTSRLTEAQVASVLAASREVMAAALAVGGTSFDSLYVNVNGESGYFDRSLQAYGRRDEPCGRCGTPIRRDAFMNRSSYSCPRCQPCPADAHW